MPRALAVAREADVPITPRAARYRTHRRRRAGRGRHRAFDARHEPHQRHRSPRRARRGGAGRRARATCTRAVEPRAGSIRPTPTRRSSCALGGNVAENAGGPRAFKYGVTRDYVLGIEAFVDRRAALARGAPDAQGRDGLRRDAVCSSAAKARSPCSAEVTLKLMPKPEACITLLASVQRRARRGERGRDAGRARASCRAASSCSTAQTLQAHARCRQRHRRARRCDAVDRSRRPRARRRGAKPSASAPRVRRQGALEVLVAARTPAQRDRLWAARREMSHAVRKLSQEQAERRRRRAASARSPRCSSI